MDMLTLLGVAHPDGTYSGRWLGYCDEPELTIPLLRRIWRTTCASDPAALGRLLLSADWGRLDPDADFGPADGMPGVGTFDEIMPAPVVREHVSRGWGLLEAAYPGGEDVGVEWLYLLDPAAASVTVYAGTVNGPFVTHSTWPLDETTAGRRLSQPCGPIREWVTPAGITAVHPALDGYPLDHIHLALAALAPGRMAVIDSCDRVGVVWVLGAGHALRVVAAVDRAAGTAILPRPLGGSWTADTPAVLLTAEQVADACHDLIPGLEQARRLYDAVVVMREVGRAGAANVAAGWAQHTIGGSASGDVQATARRVLTGIDDSDPAVLDALPGCPMDRDDSSHANGALVGAYIEHAEHLAGPWAELGAFQRDALLDALLDGFDGAFCDAITAACQTVLDQN
ncbi:hypothetical protein [Longispora albida]|uniref:hypothetical protein n=1 Tax=Longispora albida TaxID=203523 RepID=UPI0003741D00|nr:hypothetical protein [Longispora albida]